MTNSTTRSGRKPGSKTYSAPFVAFASANGMADHFKVLDAALTDFKRETASERRLTRQIAGKSKAELTRLADEAEKRARILREAVRGAPKG